MELHLLGNDPWTEGEPNLTIDEVEWVIAGGEMRSRPGVIDTSDPNATASVEVFGLPPGC